MKCIQHSNGEIKRVADDVAYSLVNSDEWKYIPKSKWKEVKRDNNKDK
ncbi:MAG: hypothetical protein GOVbin4296_18 [Prokaryotic dsDNA virus sp.]|nr:MAG: hypothetical protein GOVbin4296_18 [Prokaryotic dsDNA virus sp.]|tara:strand:+ start:326 stop:469 length:144 start_codon:yes stop_codon:yes gene_type:complete